MAETENTAATTAKKTVEIETVKMEDGRSVDFAGKREMLKESFVSDDNKVAVRFDFRNGKSLTYTIPDSLVLKFAAHGAEQKLGDETAGLKDIDDKVLAVEELAARLTSPEGWNVVREGNGMAGTSVLARALAEIKGVSLDKVKEFLKTKTQAEKIAMRNNPQVKPVVDRIEAEKVSKASKVDTEALLGELDGVGAAG
jgi:hypothetical protein